MTLVNPPILSKTRIKNGFQCRKRLHFELFHKEVSLEYSAADHANFAEGHAVGDRARQEFPGGVLIDTPAKDREGAVAATQAAMDGGALDIFEAAFTAGGVHVRVDILHRASIDAPWSVIEVKKSSLRPDDDVDPVYIEDISIQTLALTAAGINVERCVLMCLNKDYVYPEPTNLFMQIDVTAAVTPMLQPLAARIRELAESVVLLDPATISIGPHCDTPYECPYKHACVEPDGWPEVFDLPSVGPKKGWFLVARGLKRIDQLTPEEFPAKTKRAIDVLRSGQPYLDHAAVRAAADAWAWPLYFLDFETLAPALPRYQGCGPYGVVPFQFSCHVWRSPDAAIEHFEYLHLDATDPRPPLAQALVDGIGPLGSIIAFNASTEKGVIQALAADLPHLAARLSDIAGRLVDPLPIFQKNVYYAEFRGSFSIKNIAPVLAGPDYDYDRLEITGGMEARAIAEALIAGSIPASERPAVIQALLAYCRQDTLAMVAITRWMRSLTP